GSRIPQRADRRPNRPGHRQWRQRRRHCRHGRGPRDLGDMITFTEEALGLRRRAVAGAAVELLSSQHRIEGHEAGPLPPAPIPLWLGSNGPRMLAVTGRASDGWVSPLSTYLRPKAVPARQQQIDEAARAAGRNPADVRRIYNVVGAIEPAFGRSGFIGDASAWFDTLADWSMELGFGTFM